MFWSWWNKKLSHKSSVNLPSSMVFDNLQKYYSDEITNGSLSSDPNTMKISYHRGSLLFSAFGLGSELWAKHFVEVSLKEVSTGVTEVDWDIHLKLFGFQAKNNAIIEECKTLIGENG